MNAEKNRLDKAFSHAVDAGVNQLSMDENGYVIDYGNNAYDTMMNSLYASLDLMIDPAGCQRLQLFIPFFAIADEDGLYVYSIQEKREEAKLTHTWSDRIAYTAVYSGIVYEFTLSGYAITYEEGIPIKTKITDPDMIQFAFETISQTIEDTTQYYVNHHNRIARQYGVQYEFYVPSLDTSQEQRSITSPSVLVLFQGYPMVGTQETYQCFAFAGASLKKIDWFIVMQEDWYYTYHQEGCTKLDLLREMTGEMGERIGRTKKECAQMGAYPCRECIGH